MTKTINEILQILSQYFVLIYPGLISYSIYKYTKATKITENQISLMKILAISYVYTKFVQFIFKVDGIPKLEPWHHLVILLISIVLPIIFNTVLRTTTFSKVMLLFHINTNINDNPMDAIKYMEKDKDGGIILKVFIDNLSIMYEGSLRLHESDLDQEQYIILSGYRRYAKDEYIYELKNDYAANHEKWVYIKTKDVTRIEITYQNAK